MQNQMMMMQMQQMQAAAAAAAQQQHMMMQFLMGGAARAAAPSPAVPPPPTHKMLRRFVPSSALVAVGAIAVESGTLVTPIATSDAENAKGWVRVRVHGVGALCGLVPKDRLESALPAAPVAQVLPEAPP